VTDNRDKDKKMNLVLTSVKVVSKPQSLCQSHHKNKLFQLNNMLKLWEDKTTCHT